MNIQNILKMFLMAGMIGLFGCGGGGGGSSSTTTTPPAAKTTTTISGKVEFPSLSSLVAKRTNSTPSGTVTVHAYTLDGVEVLSTPGTYDAATGAYTYSLADIPMGKDYVIKAKRIDGANTQELKKLIEKSDVVEVMPTQSVDSVSTAAVVVASQKLTEAIGVTNSDGSAVKIVLGDALPPAVQSEVSKISDAIVTDVDPKTLETSIKDAKSVVSTALTTGGLSTLQSMSADEKKALADLVNMLNIVVAAVANNADPAKVLAGTETVNLSGAAAGQELKMLSVDNSGSIGQAATATSTITQAVIQETVTSAVVTYVPPRVKLEFSTNSTSLYGVELEITIPADAKVRADITGKLDMALLNVPAGARVDAQYNSTTRKVKIVIAAGSAVSEPLPAKFFTLQFDRTHGKVLASADFPHTVVKTSDMDGQELTTIYNIVKTVTSSGP